MISLDDKIRELSANDKRKPSKQPTQLLDWLWLGDQNNSFNACKYEFTHVISCINNNELELIKQCWDMHNYHPKLLHVNVEDTPITDITTHFINVLDWLLTEAKQCKPFKCLIHCQAGVNRSASLALMLYCSETNITPADAANIMWTKRPGILSNSSFRKQIDMYFHNK
jgi:protein-tyrosine phosphatase